MHDVFLRFSERLLCSLDTTDLHNALAEAALSLDLPLFAYLAPSPKSGRPTGLISTYPQSWTSHYLCSRYEAVDPVIDRARLCRDTFCWSVRDLHLSRRQCQLMDEASQFGIRCGFTIPIHDRRGLFAALTFATDEKKPLFFKAIERYELTLQLVAMVFHIYARERLVTEGTVDGFVLSRREVECLEWAARGKSAWDIGHILGISQRTAVFHLDNAKKKLGVRTITQAAIRFALSKRSDFS